MHYSNLAISAKEYWMKKFNLFFLENVSLVEKLLKLKFLLKKIDIIISVAKFETLVGPQI